MTMLCTLADLKSALNINAASNDRALELSIEAASAAIEQHCSRKFTADTTLSARVFDPMSAALCPVDDVSTTTGLVVKTDEDGDGTFETTWTSGDYVLEPLNGIADGQSWPYTRIRAVGDFLFPTGLSRPSVQITAKWGWPSEVPSAVEQACLVQAAMVFKSVDAPFGVAGFGDIGTMRLTRYLHPTAEMLVEPYRITVYGLG